MTRPYYGWNFVAYAVACQMVLVGATQSAFGLYVVPVSEEYGLTRADMNLAIVLMNVGSALFAPFAGYLADRVPLRPLLLFGAALASGSLLALSQSASAFLSAMIIGLALTAGLSAVSRPETVLIVRWFNLHRGRALTIAAMGLSLAGIVVVPFVGLIIGSLGWRAALVASAGLVGCVALVPALFLRIAPNKEERLREGFDREMDSDGTISPRSEPISVMNLLRMPQFWFIGFAVAIPMSVSQAVIISITPIAVTAGIPVAQAATLVSASGLMAISGKFGLAFVADKINQMTLLVIAFCIGVCENVLLFMVADRGAYSILFVCALMQGLSSGMLMPLFNALIARRFDQASFGTVVGLMFPIISLNNALFARYAGEVFDRTGSYKLAFATFAVMELVAIGLMLAARRLPVARAATPVPFNKQAPVHE